MWKLRGVLVWLLLVIALFGPVAAAITSPLLQWRTTVYIASGFAGILALSLLFLQPLLARYSLPGLAVKQSKFLHQTIGLLLVMLVLAHVIGLWITSPPDVIDALLFRSPTQFSVWGVIAMWCTFISAIFAISRRYLRLGPKFFRRSHQALVVLIVVGTVIHALLIEGTMEVYTKWLICGLVIFFTAKALIKRP